MRPETSAGAFWIVSQCEILRLLEHTMNYDDAWRDLHFRIRLFWLVFLGYMPGVLLIAFLLHEIFSGLDDRVIAWAAIPWMAAYGAAAIYRTWFRCP